MSIIRDFVELVRNLTANLNLKVDKSSVTSGNTASTVVSRDAGGSFSAGTITAYLNGSAANADKLLNMNWAWSGQGGQPAWLWGGSDGTNVYVYNPANFSVNYANSSNYANSAGTISGGVGANVAAIGATAVGSYALLEVSGVDTTNIGSTVAGSYLKPAGIYKDSGNISRQGVVQNTSMTGTWRCMGYTFMSNADSQITLWVRIA